MANPQPRGLRFPGTCRAAPLPLHKGLLGAPFLAKPIPWVHPKKEWAGRRRLGFVQCAQRAEPKGTLREQSAGWVSLPGVGVDSPRGGLRIKGGKVGSQCLYGQQVSLPQSSCSSSKSPSPGNGKQRCLHGMGQAGWTSSFVSESTNKCH